MTYRPQFLWVEDEASGERELQLIGVDPAGVGRMAAKMIRPLIKLHDVPCRAANILKQEMLALGGDAAVARGSVACSVPATDVLLIGSLKKLRLLCARLAHQPFGLAALGGDLERLLQGLGSPALSLEGRGARLDLQRPRIMGVLNVTPDSFSDGGCYLTAEAALRRAVEMVAEGADLIDVGGESTRPGAPAVSLQEEMDRVLPVIERLHRECGVPLSIDTTKASLAREAVALGAAFINDISGLTFDPAMAAAAAESGAGLFLMHTRGRPETMQEQTGYGDLVGEVIAFLHRSLDMARGAGVPEQKLAVDPGIGFGKSAEGNLTILRRLRELLSLGRPVLLGTSRKSFIGKVLGQADPQARLHGTMATVALGVERGARIFRVHDVAAARETAMMAWAVCQETMPDPA